MKTLPRVCAAKLDDFSELKKVYNYKNIPDQQLSARFRKSQKSSMSPHPSKVSMT